MKIFRKYKLATLLNTMGFGLALAAFYLFMTQVIFNYTYNSSIPSSERTYRVEMKIKIFGDKVVPYLPMPLLNITAGMPQVETIASTCANDEMEVAVGENKFKLNSVSMLKSTPEFLGMKPLYGRLEDFGIEKSIITRSEALRIFGKENAVGEVVEFTNTYLDNSTICAVVEDLPDNMFVGNGLFLAYNQELRSGLGGFNFSCIVRLKDNAQKAEFEKAYAKKMMELFSQGDSDNDGSNTDVEVSLRPITETWFSGVDTETDRGSRSVTNVLLGASIFMMLVALMNLTNFSLSMAPVRIKGVNTRKVLGASNGSLRMAIVADNVVLAVASLAIAALMIMLFQSSDYCMSMLQGSLAFDEHSALLLATIAIGLFTSIVAAIYPAWYATSFAPALVLKGSFALSARGRVLRNGMLFAQFAIAMALTVYVLVLKSQSHYIFNADYGFNKDELLVADLSLAAYDKKDAIRSELEKLPGVEGVAFGQFVLGDGTARQRWGHGDKEHSMSFYVVQVSPTYLPVHGIDVVQGRNFNDYDTAAGAYIINEHMMQNYQWLKLNNKIFSIDDSDQTTNFNIVGVCKNFKIENMHTDNSSLNVAFLVCSEEMKKSWGDQLQKLFVRAKAGYDKQQLRQQLSAAIKAFDTDNQMNFQFLDHRLEIAYQDELRFIAQVQVFALVSILITLIGVFSLTMFETEFRRKEIGIRKVMGASTGQVLRLFTRRYLWPLAVSFVASAPVAYLMSVRWLESFAEHTPIHWWLFPLALLLVSAVVMITVVAQSWRTARMNPVESIKSE